MTNGRHGWLVGLLVVALAAMAGCAGGSPSAVGSPFPARPDELRLDQIDPCALLTKTQVQQLGEHAGERRENSDELGSIACLWRNFPEQPDSTYLARLITKRGADYALNSGTGAQVVAIDGFAAVQTTSPYADPKEHCLLLVDVAQGQSLWVQWRTLSTNYPGLTHELACQQAQEAGRLMLGNLRGLSH